MSQPGFHPLRSLRPLATLMALAPIAAWAQPPAEASLQKLEIVEAWVEGKDGKRQHAPADRILEQQSLQSAGAPMFSDGRVKTIVFPGVEPGSVLHVHTHRTQLKPLFEGQFSMVAMPPAHMDVKAATITLQAPASPPLHVDAQQSGGGRVPTPAAMQDQGPRLAVTTLADDQAVGCKPALAVDAGQCRGLPVTLPWAARATDYVYTTMMLKLDAQGHVQGDAEVVSEGGFGPLTRQIMVSIPPGPQLLPQDYAAFRQFGQAVTRDLRAQVLY
ncbi:MAG: DUF3857 domain-containing protein [Rubrivivax sp.]|nr:DUF3857 domain-containing protein [Rubrivivax sp.]